MIQFNDMKAQVDNPVDNPVDSGDKKGGGVKAACRECRKVLPEFGLAEGLNYICTQCYTKRLKRAVRVEIRANKGKRRDPEAIIQEYGAIALSKTAAGRSVLENAKAKYPELIRKGEPGFEAYWGKEVRQREKDMAEVRAESQRMKREAGVV